MTAQLLKLIKKWRSSAEKAEKHIWIGGDDQIENETHMRDMRMCADEIEDLLRHTDPELSCNACKELDAILADRSPLKSEAIQYWKTRADTAELKVLTFYEEIVRMSKSAVLASSPKGREGKRIMMSTETKHTPGPWTYESDGIMGWFNIGSENVPLIAEAVDSTADARLIAAAPDLLEALEHQIYRNHNYSETCDVCRKSIAAIRKARGEE